MDYIKNNDLPKFMEISARLTDVTTLLRNISKDVNIKDITISILNHDDILEGTYTIKISANSRTEGDGCSFTAYTAEIENGRKVTMEMNEYQIRRTENETV